MNMACVYGYEKSDFGRKKNNISANEENRMKIKKIFG